LDPEWFFRRQKEDWRAKKSYAKTVSRIMSDLFLNRAKKNTLHTNFF
jgi:hypothetical protein